MLEQAPKPSAVVYAAIELSKKNWVTAIQRADKDQPSIHRIKGGAFLELIAKLRAATRPDERVLVCYEGKRFPGRLCGEA